MLVSKINFFIYTERPVYRAGDTVFFKIIGKKCGENFFLMQKVKVTYNITSPDGENLESKRS